MFCTRLLSLLVIFFFIQEALANTAEVGRLINLKGEVQHRTAAGVEWTPVLPGKTLQPGDSIRTGDTGWAAILMADETLVQINKNSVFTVKEVVQKASWLKLKDVVPASATSSKSIYRLDSGESWFRNKNKGITIDIESPTVTAAIRGTELNLRIEPDTTSIVAVLEGQISARNYFGSVKASAREQVTARPGTAPTKQMLLSPEYSVQWTITIPKFPDFQDTPSPGKDPDLVLLSIREALLKIEAKELNEARDVLVRVTEEHPEYALAWTLLALVRLSQAAPTAALTCSRNGTRLAPGSASAWIVQSYAYQAMFDLDQAMQSTRQALQLDEQNVTAWLNLARLLFGSDQMEKAWDAVMRAQQLAPNDPEVHNLRGFLLMAKRETQSAISAFKQALRLDPGLGEPHLGLALATMRRGDVAAASQEISSAVLLEPRRSLFLSYWAKMLYQLKRFQQALDILELASQLDPLDPTPYLYRSLILYDLNRPTESIQALNKAIALNDNRAVYRSRFLLDRDLAVKSVNLSILYNQLGLAEWGKNKALQSVKSDFNNFAGHVFLAGALFAEEGMGRVATSEALLGRLLQPANPNSFNTFNEYTSFFETPNVGGMLTGTVGSFETYQANAVVYGGIPDANTAFTANVQHQQTSGWKGPDFQRFNGAGSIVKWDPTPQDGFMFAATTLKDKTGDSLDRRYESSNPGDSFDLSQSESYRGEFGYRHHFSPDNDLLFLATWYKIDGLLKTHSVHGPYLDSDTPYFVEAFANSSYLRPYCQVQAQHHTRLGDHQFIFGTLHYWGDNKVTDDTSLYLKYGTNFIFYGREYLAHSMENTFHTYYVKDTWRIRDNFVIEAGAYLDQMLQSNGFTGLDWSFTEFDPRLGIIWNPAPHHTLRAAVFKYLLPFDSNRLDPMDIAGIPIFRNTLEGAVAREGDVSWEYEWSSGLLSTSLFHIERKFSFKLHDEDRVTWNTWDGELTGAKTTWNQMLGNGFGAAASYAFAKVSDDNQPDANRKDHRFGASLKYVNPCGLSAFLAQTYRYEDFDARARSNENIWITDLGVGYELPGKKGLLAVYVLNVFDNRFDWVTDLFTFQGRVPRREVLFTTSWYF